jgi:predicted DNA-binding protein
MNNFQFKMTLRLTPEIADDLEDLTSRIGVSRAKFIRRIIEVAIKAGRSFDWTTSEDEGRF